MTNKFSTKNNPNLHKHFIYNDLENLYFIVLTMVKLSHQAGACQEGKNQK